MTLHNHAEARLESALSSAGLEDSRRALRERLRLLRARDVAAFDQAVRRYENEVVPALADTASPLDIWLEYAKVLGELTASGRFLAIDRSGAAAPWTAPYQPGSLVLHLPDDASLPALPAAVPHEPSGPQAAATALLVEGRLG